MTKKLYKVLGIEETATQADIKSAFRFHAMRYHPDRILPNASEEEREEASTKFKELAKAYEILSNEAMRAQYNAVGDVVEEVDPGVASRMFIENSAMQLVSQFISNYVKIEEAGSINIDYVAGTIDMVQYKIDNIYRELKRANTRLTHMEKNLVGRVVHREGHEDKKNIFEELIKNSINSLKHSIENWENEVRLLIEIRKFIKDGFEFVKVEKEEDEVKKEEKVGKAIKQFFFKDGKLS